MGKIKLGQHFLTDERIIEKELHIAQLNEQDIVLEIGPGKGALTKHLASKCQQVIAVELDSNLIAYLMGILPRNVSLIHADIMDVEWDEIPSFTKVVANLPFQISSPFTFKLFLTSFEKAVLIYQQEFAKRMIASPGTKHYSRLSVGISYKADCRIITAIPPSSFNPSPKVSSSLVELIPYSSPPFHVVDEDFFFRITNLLFSHRRKQIGTILKKTFGKHVIIDISFQTQRVETLTPREIATLSNKLYPYRFELLDYK